MIYHVTSENLVEVVQETKIRLHDILEIMEAARGIEEVFVRVLDRGLDNPSVRLNRFESLRVYKPTLRNTPGLKEYIMTEEAWR
jgi:hypothetical protein